MKTYSPIDITFPCWIQPKLNGVNCTLRTDGILVSRTGKVFPAVQKAFLWPKPSLALHGELYHHGWSLQRILGAVTPDEPTEDTKEIHLSIYDCDYGQDIDERIIKVGDIWSELACDRIALVVSERADDLSELDQLYTGFLAKGFEGIVIRDLLGNVWKRKPYVDAEYQCIGVIEGKGKRVGHVGKFILRLSDGRTFHCGGGQVSYEYLRKLFLAPPVGKMLTVRYHSTSEDGVPLCAQLISVRDYE